MIWPFSLFERRSTNYASGGDSYWQDFAALSTGPVNMETAQGVSAVYACVQAISETVATARAAPSCRLPARMASRA